MSYLWLEGGVRGDDHADIIIPVYDQVAYTKACLDSIAECTRHPHRITVIDNGSTDDTPGLLQDCQEQGMPLRVIANDENLGFTKAANQGMKASTGKYVVLLNNDTTVTPGWLTGLIMIAESDDRIGIVGPKTLNPETGRVHSIGGVVFYKDHVELPPGKDCEREDPRFAQSFDCQYIEGSCMLIKRRVIEEIGCLDEAFSPGYYEDSDYCFRAREAGFRCVYSPYSEIYHYSTVTAQAVEREGVSLKEAARRNERIFRERWAHRFL